MLVASVSFDENKIFLYGPIDNSVYKIGQNVVCENIQGIEIGKIKDIYEEDPKNFIARIPNIIRLASDSDLLDEKKNELDCIDVINNVKKLVIQQELDIKVISCKYTLNRDKLIIHFTSSERVDFRELVKSISNLYKTRIELRQISTRESAKLLGGIGPCGLILCCNNFIGDFDQVTIKMAKNQNISLNPLKINGSCDKLLCCLKYEDNTYTMLKKSLPDIGDIVYYNGIEHKVYDVNLLKLKLKILIDKENHKFDWIDFEEVEIA